MASHEIHIAADPHDGKVKQMKDDDVEEEERSPVEQVRLTVPNHDDPSLPVWTFRMWFLGLLSCAVLSFLDTFFQYRSSPLVVTLISAQVATLPLGRFMAKTLPTTKFRIPGFGSREFSLNPGPFNIKEHALISIFANAGSAFGGGTAYAIGILNIVKALYHRKMSFLAAWILVITTQVLGYGWAGIMRKYVIDPAEMWWPSSLVQVSLFRALHEKDNDRMSRAKFFLIVMMCSFCWYIFPNYFMSVLSSVAVVCYAFPKSVTAQQIGSAKVGLSLGAFTFDWSVVAAFLGSPLISPFFATMNILVGYILFTYVAFPLSYWVYDLYDAKKFPLLSTDFYTSNGTTYDPKHVTNENFELDTVAYQKYGRLNLSIFFALSYAISFAGVMATLTHVMVFNGREIYRRFRASTEGKVDIHTKLMRKYKDIPSWWFTVMLALSMLLSLALCIFMKDQVQLPWWGLLFSAGVALIFTLPISIITATTNQTPGLNVITEYIFGLIYPGRPVANVCFKTYGYISMAQAVSFLNDFKLGHYMKIPPRSMFVVQFIGTVIAGTINTGVAWWMLTSIKDICNKDKLPPGSVWTCPGDNVFFDASVIWGLIGPRKLFGPEGNYGSMNWLFLVGAIAPILVYLVHKAFPNQKWITLINLPIILGATGNMPPATPLNFNSWLLFAILFNYVVFRHKKKWWQKYNYVLSAGLDAGVAFSAVLVYLSLQFWNDTLKLDWWGNAGEHCDLANCPTAKGIVADGCPVF